jgi:hypothetical protein
LQFSRPSLSAGLALLGESNICNQKFFYYFYLFLLLVNEDC